MYWTTYLGILDIAINIDIFNTEINIDILNLNFGNIDIHFNFGFQPCLLVLVDIWYRDIQNHGTIYQPKLTKNVEAVKPFKFNLNYST